MAQGENVRKAAPLGLDNPTGLGLPPDPLGQVQLFTGAPPRCLPHSAPRSRLVGLGYA